MALENASGIIRPLAYSQDNSLCTFELFMFKPYKMTFAIGIYNFNTGVTWIKKCNKFGKVLTGCWIDIAKRILSKNDWDENVYNVKGNKSVICKTYFLKVWRSCIY